MVMQDVNYELFADSVESECTFGIRNPKQTLVDATLEELALAPFRDRHPNTLSGGQKQRVAVAVSMICGKDLLVFDEPTSGTDRTQEKPILCCRLLTIAKAAWRNVPHAASWVLLLKSPGEVFLQYLGILLSQNGGILAVNIAFPDCKGSRRIVL